MSASTEDPRFIFCLKKFLLVISSQNPLAHSNDSHSLMMAKKELWFDTDLSGRDRNINSLAFPGKMRDPGEKWQL